VFRSTGQPGFSASVSSDPRHVEARKFEREIQVRFTTVECTVQTLEGVVYAQPGDAIVTGTGGEHWRVSKARFRHKYRPAPGTTMGMDGAYFSLRYRILAVQMRENFQVWLADGVSCLTGQPGDWLVDYGDGSFGVVAQPTFATTYEILS
jgi:hypothetical protein